MERSGGPRPDRRGLLHLRRHARESGVGPLPNERAQSNDEKRGGAPEQVGAILQRFIKRNDLRPRKRGGVMDVWRRASGEDLADTTKPGRLLRGVLVVDVNCSSLLHELQSFRQQELLDRVLAQDTSGRITGLKFRLGAF